MTQEKKRVNRLFLIMAALLIPCGAALFFILTPGKAPAARNVLVITLDTTRADRIGAYGYKNAQTPYIDKLAREGVTFEDAFSSVPITLPSHCTIFTGKSTLYHKVRNNGTYVLPGEVETLAEKLKNRGFETAAFTASFTVDSRFGLNQGFDVYDDNVGRKGSGVKAFASERPAGKVFQAFSKWFKARGKKPFFCWIHFYDAHRPYLPPEPYKTRFRKNPYDGEVGYMDENVGMVMALLKSEGVFEDTLVVVAGDHGEAFGEHGELGHQIFCYEENLRVPLIFWDNSTQLKPKRIGQKVNLVDITPTILDYLGAERVTPAADREDRDTRGALTGRSLLRQIKGGKRKPGVYYIESVFAAESLGCAPVKGIVKDGYKYLDLPRPELYRLTRDPGEKENLFFKQNALARKMKQRMAELVKTHGHTTFESKRKLSEQDFQRLETLGYISASSTGQNTTDTADTAPPDPKDKIPAWSEYMNGNEMLRAGNTGAAAASFKRSLEINPSFSWAHGKLAMIYYLQGEAEKAEVQYRAGIAANPSDNIIKADLANLLVKEKRYVEAEELLKVMRDMNLMDVGAYVNNLLGTIYMANDDYASAADCYRKAVEIEPDNRLMRTLLAFSYQRAGRMPEALDIYHQLDREDPNDFYLLSNMAMAHAKNKEFEDAFGYFERALKIKQPHMVYYNYARVLSQAGKHKEAIKKMKKFLEMYTRDDLLRYRALQFVEKMEQPK